MKRSSASSPEKFKENDLEVERLRQSMISLTKHIDAYELQTEDLTEVPSIVSKLFIKNLRRVIGNTQTDNILNTSSSNGTLSDTPVSPSKRDKRTTNKGRGRKDSSMSSDTERTTSSSSRSKSKGKPPRNDSPAVSSSTSHLDKPEVSVRTIAMNTTLTKIEIDDSKSGKKNPDMAFEEIPEAYLPSPWLSEVRPNRTPYFPQLGDDLVYFRQGHELYVKLVEGLKVYPIDDKMRKALPFNQNSTLPAEVSVRVVQINYELLPPRLVNLKLARTHWETGKLMGSYIFVRYHDMNDLVDFLVLRQLYDKAVSQSWAVDDRFRSFNKINKSWWLGSVVAKKPFTPQFPDSNFLSYDVEWEGHRPGDGERVHDNLSAWDMEIVIPKDSTKDDTFVYEPRPEDWGPSGQALECQRVSSLVQAVMNLPISSNFSTPIDVSMYPEYAYAVEYPIDLTTIKNRLLNHFYRRSHAVTTDIDHISTNANKFNLPEHDYVKHATVVKLLLTEILQNANFDNLEEAYRRTLDNYNGQIGNKAKKKIVATQGGGFTPTSPVASNSDGGSRSKSKKAPTKTPKAKKQPKKRRESKTKPSTTIEVWNDKCQKLVTTLWAKGYSAPFRHPVSIEEYPDYIEVITTPMSLSVIRENLREAKYSALTDFKRDMMLIFENSRQYNTEPNSIIRLMTERLYTAYQEGLEQFSIKESDNSSEPSVPSNKTPDKQTTPDSGAKKVSSKKTKVTVDTAPTTTKTKKDEESKESKESNGQDRKPSPPPIIPPEEDTNQRQSRRNTAVDYSQYFADAKAKTFAKEIIKASKSKKVKSKSSSSSSSSKKRPATSSSTPASKKMKESAEEVIGSSPELVTLE